jgi:hypothetical protein
MSNWTPLGIAVAKAIKRLTDRSHAMTGDRG